MTNQTNLNENLNEVENTTSQTTTTPPQDSELKITFLGREKEIINYSEKLVPVVKEKITYKKEFSYKPIIKGTASIKTTSGTVYSESDKTLAVNTIKGNFVAKNGNTIVDYESLANATATYQCISRNLGLCAVLQVGGKNYIFDVGLEDNCQSLIDFIEDPTNNINQIDGLIITHFHGDHIGTKDKTNGGKGLFTLLNNKKSMFTNCYFYLPHQANIVSTYYSDVYDMIIANCLNGEFASRIIYPSFEGQEIQNTIGDNTKIKFYNVSQSYFNDYAQEFINHYGNKDDEPRYNNYSMVTIIEHYGHKIALTGDIEYAAQNKLSGVIEGVDVLQIEHHGFNGKSPQSYLDNLTAKIGVIPGYDYWSDSMLLGPTVNKILNNGGEVYYTSNNGNVTVYSNENEIYVDSNLKTLSNPYIYNSINAGIPLKGDGTENFHTLDFGVYTFSSKSILQGISNYPEGIKVAGKIMVECISTNKNAKKVTVIANDESGTVATKFRRSSGGAMYWTDWMYSTPHIGSVYGEYDGGSYELKSNGNFIFWIQKNFIPTQSTAIEYNDITTGYFTEKLYQDLPFEVESALAFGNAGNLHIVTNTYYDATEKKIGFRLTKSSNVKVNEAITVRLLIVGKKKQ